MTSNEKRLEDLRERYQITVMKQMEILAALIAGGHHQATAEVVDQFKSTVEGFDYYVGLSIDTLRKETAAADEPKGKEGKPKNGGDNKAASGEGKASGKDPKDI